MENQTNSEEPIEMPNPDSDPVPNPDSDPDLDPIPDPDPDPVPDSVPDSESNLPEPIPDAVVRVFNEELQERLQACAFVEKLSGRLDEVVPKPDPGLSLKEFKALAYSYRKMFAKERASKPSQQLYKAVNAKPRTKVVAVANATYAGQLLIIISDNGGWAERIKPHTLRITYGPWMRDTLNKLVNQFKKFK